MAFFTNANGERIAAVTNNNLQDFFEYAKNEKDFDRDIKIADAVKLDDFFAEFEYKTDEEKYALTYLITRSAENENNLTQERKQEYYDLAKKHPEAFRRIYELCDSRSFKSVYKLITDKANNSTLTENLYFINSLIDSRDYMGFVFHGRGTLGGTEIKGRQTYREREDIRTLPRDKAEIIAKLFADANSYNRKCQHNENTSVRENYSAQIVSEILSRGDLLNYEPKRVNIAGITAQEIRAEIEKWINKDNITDLDKKFIFDGKCVNKDLLKLKFNSVFNKDEFVQTSGEQKVHNAEEMRKYVETRDLILDAAESVVGKYIPNGRGEERTNTQKFKALVEELYGTKFDEYSGSKVVQDYLLSASYRDINEGNAAKLSDDELLLVVERDKDGYWLQKINEKSPESAKKIIKEMNGSFSVRQSRIADMIAPEITMEYGNQTNRTGDIFDTKYSVHRYDEYALGVANSKFMSTKEKEEFLDKAAVFVDENLLKKAKEDKEFAAEFRQDYAEHEELYNQAHAKEELKNGLTNLQGLYADIVENFDNGKPNETEKHLSKENVEEILKDIPNCQGLEFPQQGKLPLVIGRKKEESRRAELVQRIRKFNDELMSLQSSIKNPQNKWAKYADISEYDGKLLESSTIDALKAEQNEKNTELRENRQKLNDKYDRKGKYGGMYNYNDAERAENVLDMHTKKAQNILTEKQRVLARKQQLEETAKSILPPEKSSLQTVKPDMNKDTKTAVRQANKQIADTLAKPIKER